MQNNMNLPNEYQPFNTLNICSNIATNYQVPIGAKNYAPLLIGKGVIPLVWIAVNNPDNTEKWRYLVSMNKSLHPDIKVEVNEAECTVVIVAGTDTLLKVKANSPDNAEIISLDLRPIGLNIVGNSGGLQVGGSSLTGNMFSGVGTVIGLG